MGKLYLLPYAGGIISCRRPVELRDVVVGIGDDYVDEQRSRARWLSAIERHQHDRVMTDVLSVQSLQQPQSYVIRSAHLQHAFNRESGVTYM